MNDVYTIINNICNKFVWVVIFIFHWYGILRLISEEDFANLYRLFGEILFTGYESVWIALRIKP
ncbi:hypothetical protein ECZU41_42290 [Escherichia coli]|nr:hypothetical protein HMPREF9534_05363 [Escherichia coli MS 69-1]ESD76215.1 hypothetical protein HMPREF1611_05622 [Escherichia coli 908573]BCM32578.1 hypothetical protein ExPECSC054_2566 [Escherichia coli]BDO64256.1 hypothetical protein TUM2330_06970 [Escherichia coli]GHL33167.1 hypothetical protein ECZU26_39920 [Escherichia coli]